MQRNEIERYQDLVKWAAQQPKERRDDALLVVCKAYSQLDVLTKAHYRGWTSQQLGISIRQLHDWAYASEKIEVAPTFLDAVIRLCLGAGTTARENI